MLHLKLLIGLCLATSCILAHHDIDFSGTSEQLSIEDFEDDKCAAPNGLGLRNLIIQAQKLLPLKEILEIYNSYSEDPEIKALEAFVSNPETNLKIKAIEQSKEFQLLKEYSCNVLHLNLDGYHKIVNPSNKRDANSEHKGIMGFIRAVVSVLPRKELRELYENLMKTDYELVKAVAHLKSDEFHQLLLNVKNLPEYQELRKEMKNLGVPVDEIDDLLAKALGWEDKCAAPNGLGLRNLLIQAEKLLPIKEIMEIYISYSEDPEIKALEAFIRNPQTSEKLKAIQESKEFQMLKDYSCRILHLDFDGYHKFVRSLFKPSNKRAVNSERNGIKGFINALKAVLPLKELRELYEHLMKTDDELVKAVAHLKSEEFHQLLLNVKNLPENQELRKEMINLGVPLDEMDDFLANLLGWSNSENVLF